MDGTYMQGWQKMAIIGCSASFAAAAGFADTASAGARHRRHHVTRAASASDRPVIPYGYSFYPHEIEGGVSGNLPFNNQIRKFRDPLNANGGGG